MKRVKRLYKATNRLGYNTRDNPQQIPYESCQSLVNALPGDPSLVPRDGISKWNTLPLPQVPPSAFPWADAIDPKVILRIGNSFYWKVAGAGGATLIGDQNIIPEQAKLSFCRVKDQLLVNTDQAGDQHRAWIISWNGSTFVIRNLNLLGSLMVLSATPVAGGNVQPLKWKSYSFTFVNRQDAESKDGSGNPKLCRLQDGNFHPGLNESVDDIDRNRITAQNSSSSTAQGIQLTAGNGGSYDDEQTTHLRIYGTLEGDTEAAVQGLEHRWLADLPLIGPNAYSFPWTFVDTASNAEMAGSLNFSLTVGYEDIPPGTYMRFHQGRLWVGGSGTGEVIGRHFYSETPFDFEFPQKWWGMFRSTTHFKDTSYDDSEPGMGLGVSKNDLIFVGKRAVWYLRDGDISYEPFRMSTTHGTEFPRSLTEIGEDLFYLSNVGPVVVSGRQIQPMDAHTAAEVWPKAYDNRVGYFYGLPDKTKVEGFYFKENWFLTDGVKLIGFFMPEQGNQMGPWSVEVADPDNIGFHLPLVLSPDVCVLISKSISLPFMWRFLAPGVSADNGKDFFIRSKSKDLYVSPLDRDRAGEAYTLRYFSHYEDSAPTYITIYADTFRFQLELEYNEFGTSNQMVSPQANITFREVMEQPFPEGLVGSYFAIEFRKQHKSPYTYTNKGFVLEYLPVEGHPSEFISRSAGDGLVEEHPDTLLYLKLDDDLNTARDFSIYARDHGYNPGFGGGRTWGAAFVPGGGQTLLGAANSGYYLSTWSGLDRIGDNGGLNSSPLTYEIIFKPTSLAQPVVLYEAGDGTNYIRWLINTNGSLEFQISTSGGSPLSRRYTSPVGAVSVGTWYTLQFVLTNQGQNGQFYGGPRTGSFANMLTTAAAL